MEKPKIEELIALETKRLAEQYGKSFLDIDDIMKITGLGRNNVRALIHSNVFATKKIGKRVVVSILNFVTWQCVSQ